MAVGMVDFLLAKKPVSIMDLFIPPNPNPRITNVVHIPYFFGRPGDDPDTHIAKFEVTCVVNSIPPTKFQEVFAASLQEDAFSWYLRQPAFADWNA